MMRVQAQASQGASRPDATVSQYTGETVREFPFLEAGQIPGVVRRAAGAFQSWRKLPGDQADPATALGPLSPERAAEDLIGEVRDAVDLANATSLGLGGTVLGSDQRRARSVADRLDSGMVWLNQPTSTQADLPSGGVKRSGPGRQLSRVGRYGFTNRKLTLAFPPVT